jgi:hypothetical protein
LQRDLALLLFYYERNLCFYCKTAGDAECDAGGGRSESKSLDVDFFGGGDFTDHSEAYPEMKPLPVVARSFS